MQNSGSTETSAQIKKLEPKQVQKLTLRQLMRADQDVRDFYKLIEEFDMRAKALELVEKRLTQQ